MELRNVSLSYGMQDVFDDICLIIPEQEKIGVVGVNGAGKSTFLKVLMKKEELDSGSIVIKNNQRIDWLPQIVLEDMEDKNISVFDYLKSGRPIETLENKLQSFYEKLANPLENFELVYKKIDNIQNQLNYWDQFQAMQQLDIIIQGIGIKEELLLQKLSQLSGGQKSKVAFAKLLYSNPEIILLDEPTNHMDKESRDFIIEYLKNYHGTVFVISHDIDFLNQITTKTLFIDKRTKKIKLFDGNYDKFLKLQTEYEENLKREAKKEEQEENKLREIITKYATASGKRKQMAKDREKKLEKLLENKVKILDENKKVNLKMEIHQELNAIPITISDLSFKYNKNGKNIIDHLSFSLYKGEKFLIVGKNGAGKSTLLKLIYGSLTPDSGIIKIGNKVIIGYYAQELEGLEMDRTILDNFSDLDLSLNKVRSVLGKFLFYGDDVFKKINVLSPGERARVALAKLSVSGANLLLLDEPTNHLDKETQSIIGEVFSNYLGSIILVSHNDAFINKINIERTLHLPSGKISYYK